MKVYNKLVRNNIPSIIEKSGKRANYRELDQVEYEKALKAKLLEEVNEFLEAVTYDEIVEELADIDEVLYSIQDMLKNKGFEVLDKRYYKAMENGSFSKRYFLESVEEIDE